MEKKKETKSVKFQYLKEAIFIAVSLILIFLLLLLIRQINTVSDEIGRLENSKNEGTSVYVLKATEGTISDNKEKIDKINSYFIDDTNIVSFVKEIDLLKAEGTVTQFSFVSDKPIADTVTGYSVLPFEIVFQGDKTNADNGLKKVLELPYLIRCVVTEIDKKDDGSVIIKLGGFLYVNENFGKDR